MSTEQTTPSAPPRPIPPLENGDRLTREEFERRYDAMPHVKKAELINGVVRMPSPVRHRHHSRPHFHLIGWLYLYESATPGVEGGDNGTARLDVINEPQPDAMLLILPECGGQARISEDDYVEHAPELVAEVSASTVSTDLNDKLEVYRRVGVREYLVWRVQEQAIDWFALRGEKFERLVAQDGIHRSEVLPGLWLDAAALLRGDGPRVQEVAQQGVASREHADFVARLQAARNRPA
jgi:Uma2 family endonuclease